MQIDHKITIIGILKTIQTQYAQNPDRLKVWVDFERKVAMEIDTYSLSHKLSLLRSLRLFLKSLKQIQTAKSVITQVNILIKQ